MFIKKLFLLLNMIFFLYFAIQLLVFTDEFAQENIGFFNHAVAGLAEAIGIIFFSFFLSLIIIFFKGIDKQFPFFITIFLTQFTMGIGIKKKSATKLGVLLVMVLKHSLVEKE